MTKETIKEVGIMAAIALLSVFVLFPMLVGAVNTFTRPKMKIPKDDAKAPETNKPSLNAGGVMQDLTAAGDFGNGIVRNINSMSADGYGGRMENVNAQFDKMLGNYEARAKYTVAKPRLTIKLNKSEL